MCASLASIFLATPFAVNAMPEAAHDDTEVVTNHSFTAIRSDSRVFSFALELDATPSNNVEVAFGRDADGDGVLSRFEATMRVGWDCGVWEIVDCATGDVFSEPGSPGPVSLSWMLIFFSRWRSEVAYDGRFWHRRFRGACRASTAVPVLQGLEHGTRHLPRH